MKSLLNVIHSYLCLFFVITATVIFGFTSLVSLLFNPGGKISFLCLKTWAKLILLFCGIRVTVWGRENISKEKIQIFASNHLSQLDILVLSSIIPVKFGFVAKKELFKIPVVGWHMKANNYVSVDRSNKKKALESFYESAEQIRNGKRIVIFPEGTRSREGVLQPFKKGLFHLCARTNVPVVPICIEGTYQALLPDTLRIHPGKVFVNIGEEINTNGKAKGIQVKNLMNNVRNSIVNLQDEVKGYISSQKDDRSLSSPDNNRPESILTEKIEQKVYNK